MGKPIIVQLKIYKGAKFQYDEDKTTIINESQDLSLKYDSREWHNWMSKMYRNGWGKAKVEFIKQETERVDNIQKYEDVSNDVFNRISSEMNDKLKPQKEVKLTPEQKEIERLTSEMAEMKALINKGKDNTPDVNEELEAARDKYFDVFGKRPNNLLKLSSLNAKIEEEQNK